MVVLSALVFLPKQVVAGIALLTIVGHNCWMESALDLWEAAAQSGTCSTLQVSSVLIH